MEVKLFKSLWGMTDPLDVAADKIKKAGYCGLESPVPSRAKINEFKEIIDSCGLECILDIYTDGDYISSFEEQVHRAALCNPVLIVSQSAKDSMPFDEQVKFFTKAVEIEKQVGIPVAHETHRSRAMFTPWSTARLLRQIPELRIAADFSHWCCVCESFLEDQDENLEIAMERSIHIHGRVGYTQGPQVNDPRAPENEAALTVHMQWWKRIYEEHKKRGDGFITFTPEFGPAPYMPLLPHTAQPVADLWDVCLWMTKSFEQALK